MLKNTVIFLFLLMAIFCCAAQDTVVPIKRGVRQFILPSVGVAYGAASLSVMALKDINATVQRNTMAGTLHPTNIDDYLQYAPLVAGHVLMIAGVKGQHTVLERLLIDVIAAGSGTYAVFALKRITLEERPDHSDNHSFPSGHTALAFASAEMLRVEYGKRSPWYGIGGYAVAGLTAYLRLYNDVHWFGDVVAGASIGILSVKVANLLVPLIERKVFKKRNHKPLDQFK